MRTYSRLALMAVIVVIAAPALAEDLPFHEIAAQVGVGLDAPNAEGFGTNLRPLDDSDTEARALMQRFFDMTPCGGESVESADGMCDHALELLRGGGDQLARYLVRQVEANEAEGFPNRGTYLRLLGLTESPVAVQYLQNEVATRRKAFEAGDGAAREQYLRSIEALGRTRAIEAAQTALVILQKSEDPEVQLRAVNAFDRAQARHGPLPDGAAQLAAVEEADGERQRAAAEASPASTSGSLVDPWREVRQRIEKVLRDPGHTR